MILNFGNKFYDTILCLDGELPDIHFFSNFKNIEIIAADGAGLKLLNMNIKPNVIIGDLDTFYKNPINQTLEDIIIIQISEQETNDFEKALNYILNYGFKDILILGFHGGELEHTLNNWSVFKKFSPLLNMCIYDIDRYAIPVNKFFEFKCKIYETISLVPQPKAVVSTEGLQWELTNETLELGVREGIRNIALKNSIKINIIEGELLLFIDARIPYCPEWIDNDT